MRPVIGNSSLFLKADSYHLMFLPKSYIYEYVYSMLELESVAGEMPRGNRNLPLSSKGNVAPNQAITVDGVIIAFRSFIDNRSRSWRLYLVFSIFHWVKRI